MARVIKIDNVLQKRFAQSKKKSKSRDINIFILIVCEGTKTEPNYFKSFPKSVGQFVFDIQTEGTGMNTLNVVDKAIELRDSSDQEYDRVWAVFDKDSFKANTFNGAISKAAKNGICCAWSNEAFELWYLLHFQFRNNAMSRTDYAEAIEREVNKKWNKKIPYKYFKNDEYSGKITKTYDILQKYGNQNDAIENAKKLSEKYFDTKYQNHNPRTQVFELVEQLIGKDEILNAEIKKKYEVVQ